MLRVVYNKKPQRSLHGMPGEVFDSGEKMHSNGLCFWLCILRKIFYVNVALMLLYGNMVKSVKTKNGGCIWREETQRKKDIGIVEGMKRCRKLEKKRRKSMQNLIVT